MAGRGGNNHIAEWFGHRVFPVVADSPQALSDQVASRCPFLSDVIGSEHACTKTENAKGVCTVSASSNGQRQDWLVCPFRALDRHILEDAGRRLFGHDDPDVGVSILAATVLADPATREAMANRVRAGEPAIVYFQNKLGGEISISRTDRSPELSFDATMVEVLAGPSSTLRLGRYGIFEIQTMDFHGSYRGAVANLRNALGLHKNGFADAVQAHPEWAAEGMEGPNIANVFKRTFYQMMFKFRIGAHPTSAGCVLAIPRSVWDSWQRHLGAPELVDNGDGTWRLAIDDSAPDERPAAWIYVFDVDESGTKSPNELLLWRVIGTDAEAMSHYAMKVAPDAALEEGGSVDAIAATLRKRLGTFVPEGFFEDSATTPLF